MLRVFGQSESPLPGQRPVVTIGMFDGVHRGHQAVLGRTQAVACERGVPSLAITFDVHPRRRLEPGQSPAMITSLEHRLVLLEERGLVAVWVLSFDEALARMKAADFVHAVLVERLATQAVVLGDDAHFGHDREGDIALLRRMSEAAGFEVVSVPPVLVDGRVVSSTEIRNAVQGARLECARRMLGRPMSVLGTVVHGAGRGRRLGFPTLNLDPHHELHPPQGVYVSRTRCGNTVWDSVTNVGHRPTGDAKDSSDVLVESHLLGYRGELYGQTVEVMFFEKLREERAFPSDEALGAQIAADVEAARAYFAKAERLRESGA